MPMITTHWVHVRLGVLGWEKDVAGFVEQARGPGSLPWASDGTPVNAEAARLHMKALADCLDDPEGCPLDLHSLMPVPHAILERASEPYGTAWCRENWGTPFNNLRTDGREDVSLTSESGPSPKTARAVYEFWSAENPPLGAFRAASLRSRRVVLVASWIHDGVRAAGGWICAGGDCSGVDASSETLMQAAELGNAAAAICTVHDLFHRRLDESAWSFVFAMERGR